MKTGWEIKKLGEVCDVFAGQGAPQGESNYGIEGVPFIKAGNLEDLINGLPESMIQHVSDEVAKKHKLKLYESNSIVFAKSGMSCMKGHIYTLIGDCYVVSHLAILTPRKIVSSFLNYVLRFHRPNSLIKDSAYPSISLEDIKSFSIPIPPLPEQERIVSELDFISGVIEKKKQQLKELDSLAQSIFYEMFGNPVENEKGWEKIPFEKSIEKVKYTTKIPSCNYCGEGMFPIISQEDEYISGFWNNSDDVFRISKPIVIFGDHTRILKYIDFDFVLGADGVKILQPVDSINARFFKLYLELSKIPSLGYSRHYKLLKELNVFTPPLSLQQEFASMIESIEKQKELIKHSLQETETLFNSRMDYYFN